MYHPRVVQKKIELLQRHLDEQNKATSKELWALTIHTALDVKRAIDHFGGLLDDNGKLKRALTLLEQRWIDNETMMCQASFRYFAERYAKILHWSGGDLVPFEFNAAQEIILDIWGELELLGQSISIANLKARQLGVTTLVQCALVHRLMFIPNTEAVMASNNPEKSMLMAEKFERFYFNTPYWLRPELTGLNRGERYKFEGQGCAVRIEHGSQKAGIGRGSTPTAAHLSEVSEYQNPEELIDSSLLRAMHPSPHLFMVMESQAGGRHSWWHKVWLQAKEGRGRFRPTFLPWFVGTDLYPTTTWLKERPIPKDWKPGDLTSRHAERANHYVRTTPLLTKHLGADWAMSKAQMWWWETTRLEYAEKGELPRFYVELPADDIEAFQSLATGVFTPEIISNCKERIRPPVGVFGFEGPGISIKFQPERRAVDTSRPKIDLPDGYKLIPLRWQNDTDPQGKLFVYEMAKQNFDYGLGVDTGDGLGLDRTALQMVRKGDLMMYNDIQVAEYFNDQLGAADAAPICYAMLQLFPSFTGGEKRQSKAVIECARNGENTQHELRKMGWRNFHRWVRYDAKIIRHDQAARIGWFTNVWSRSMMMDYLIRAITDGIISINSPWLVDELSDLERNEQVQSLKAAYGGHDDLIMALGIVWFSLHIMELTGSVRTAFQSRRKLEEDVEFAKYTGDFQASGEKPPESLLWRPSEDRMGDYGDADLPDWY